MRRGLLATLVAFLAACQAPQQRPLPSAAAVDLARFMGDWYVIAATPTFLDARAHDAVESYRSAADGGIETTYTFRDGGFDAPLKRFTARARVRDASNAVWAMRFVWPFDADYRIAYLSDDYGQTVIARERRDYAWIMARSPTLAPEDLRRLEKLLADAGYDTARLRRIPHQSPRNSP